MRILCEDIHGLTYSVLREVVLQLRVDLPQLLLLLVV